MGFWQTFKQSFYSPALYRSLPGRPFPFTLRYFLTLILIISVIVTVPLTAMFLPRLQFLISDATNSLLNSMPDDLVITIHGGQAAVNQPEPYTLPVPDAIRQHLGDRAKGVANLLVVDTQHDFTVDYFKQENTLFLLTRDALIGGDPSGKLQIEPLDEVPDTVINKQKAQDFSDSLARLGRFIVPVVVLGVFLVMLFVFATALLSMLLGALLVWLIALIRGTRLHYWGAYKTGLHAATLGLLLNAFSIAVPLPPAVAAVVPALVILSFVVICWLNLAPGSSGDAGATAETAKT